MPLKDRTKAFALRIIRVYAALPHNGVAEVLGKQVLRSGTSVGAHYREACRARSIAEFISKLEVGLQELDETAYWLELLVEGDVVPAARLASLQQEADELTATFASSITTAKERRDS
jgi:four helix bundle protein